VAMALYDDDVEDLAVELITPPDDAAALKPAAERLGARLGTPLRDLSPRDHVGLVLVDGMSLGEERMMDCLGGLTDMKIVGGSAGDDLKFKETFVAARGQCSARGAVLAVLKPRRRFDILKTQSFRRGGRVLCATRVDEAARIVHEFDGRPAAAAYAEAIGCPLAALSSHFMSRPLGLVVDDEPYVRSPQRVVDDSVAFYCAVKTGMELEVLDATNIIEDTQRALAAKVTELGGLRGIVNFNCILRTLELEQRGLQTQYAELFRDYPTIGFSTYGEQYLGHINQTATMLLFS